MRDELPRKELADALEMVQDQKITAVNQSLLTEINENNAVLLQVHSDDKVDKIADQKEFLRESATLHQYGIEKYLIRYEKKLEEHRGQKELPMQGQI